VGEHRPSCRQILPKKAGTSGILQSTGGYNINFSNLARLILSLYYSNDKACDQKHKKSRKMKKIQQTDIPRQFPKMAVLPGTKMAKSTFYRHERFRPKKT